MKKTKKRPKKMVSEVLAEYDFRGGERGRYAGRYRNRTNVIVLAPELTKVFPDSAAVNEALRTLLRLVGKKTFKSARAATSD